jgi:hypothetical protein
VRRGLNAGASQTARQAEGKHLYLSIYEYKIFTITLAILLAVICTHPDIKVLSFKALFFHIELKHVYLKEAVVRGYR